MEKRPVTYPLEDRWSYVWLLIGLGTSLFTVPVGNLGVPILFWISPIFFIRFMRSQRRWWLAYLILLVTMGLVTYLAMPASLESVRISSTVGAAILVNFLFVADRLLAARLPGFANTLVFPLGFTALEFINTLTNPIGSFGSTIYTQSGNLALLQLVSITGMWALTFLIMWLAPIVNWAWERSFRWQEIRGGVLFYGGILFLVLIYGQVRLMTAPPPADTVRVAGIVAVDYRAELEEINRLVKEDWLAFRQLARTRQALYLEETVREARAGAKIIVWPEMATPGAKEDEAELETQAQAVARREGIYLIMPMLVRQNNGEPYENKLLILDPQGQTVLEHFKYGGVSTGLEGYMVQGDGLLRTVKTPYGTLSGLICWDTDFPRSVLQAGRNGTDILLSPSLDFRDIVPLHSHMAMVRAIENGVSVVRVADNGLSAVYDPYGRSLATTNHFTKGQRVIVAQVPTEGINTIYPVVGDFFGWLSVVGFVAIIMMGLVRGRREKTPEAVASDEELAPAIGQRQ